MKRRGVDVMDMEMSSTKHLKLDENEKVDEAPKTDFSIFIVKSFSKETRVLKEEESEASRKKVLKMATELRKNTGKMPSEAELEDFFSAAEKYDQNRFAEKYNYDIVKDVPLEGRYEWIKF